MNVLCEIIYALEHLLAMVLLHQNEEALVAREVPFVLNKHELKIKKEK